MAVNTPRVFHPKLPRPFDTSQLVIDYDRVSDTLSVFASGATPRPGVSVPISDFEYVRVDATTEEIIGLQVEDFLIHAVYVNPLYLSLAEFAGVEEPELAAIRAAVEERQRRMDPWERRQALLDAMLGGLRLTEGVA